MKRPNTMLTLWSSLRSHNKAHIESFKKRYNLTDDDIEVLKRKAKTNAYYDEVYWEASEYITCALVVFSEYRQPIYVPFDELKNINAKSTTNLVKENV